MASCAPPGAIGDLGIILNSATVQSPYLVPWAIRATIPKARTMTEPTLTCPSCRTQIKLTESLAAPLIEDTRRRYEDQLARKEAEVAGREAAIGDPRAQIHAAKYAIAPTVGAKFE